MLASVLILERILKENNNNKEISIIQVPYSCLLYDVRANMAAVTSVASKDVLERRPSTAREAF